MRRALAVLVLAAAVMAQAQRPAASATEKMYQSAAASAARKFRHIERNGEREPPDQTPTVLTEREINAYLSSGEVDFPDGVRSLQVKGRGGVLDALARVDFDQITASRGSRNPLLVLFTGVHDVRVVAGAAGSNHVGTVHVQSMEIDGVTVPRAALDFFVQRYVTPRYPQAKLDSRFPLPHRIDIAIVGDGQLTVTQK